MLLGSSGILFYFFYPKTDLNAENALFVYSTDYKGCKIFNNTYGWMSKDEVDKQIDQLKIDCSDSPYIYLTAFKHADSLSYFSCQHPLKTSSRANCRSYYFINNLDDE